MRYTKWSRFRAGLVAAVVLVALAASVGIGTAASQDSAPQKPAPASQTLAWTQLESLPCAVAAAAAAPGMSEISKTTYVYITKTGKKYHKSGCRYLKKSKIKKTLAWAKKHGYKRCTVCKPPK